MSYGSAAVARLAGKTILITGASAGIGQATAHEFANAAQGNLKLVLTARRIDKLDALKKDLEAKYAASGITVLAKKLDVSKTSEVAQFVKDLPKEFSNVDVLVNNA